MRWSESSTSLGGFRSLTKTKEAPYTTKVNYEKLNLYREAVSRGTTLYDREPCALRVCSGRFVCIVHLWDTVECTYDIKPLAVERRSPGVACVLYFIGLCIAWSVCRVYRLEARMNSEL
eukprot:scaffold97645_cov75-Phaeocystis_antarctica.AAC.2